MNEIPNPYDAVIADLRSKRDQIDQLIQYLELFKGGVPMPPPGTIPSPTILGMAAIATNEAGQIAPGTFHGLGIEEGVRTLLRIRKRAMTAPELAEDLRAGGLHFNPKSIASVLHRSFMSGGDIVRKERGQWGLQEWYPSQRFKRGED